MPLVSFTHPTLLRLGSLHKVVLSRLYFISAGVGPLYQSLVISDKTLYNIGVNSVNTVIIINGIDISLDVCKNWDCEATYLHLPITTRRSIYSLYNYTKVENDLILRFT